MRRTIIFLLLALLAGSGHGQQLWSAAGGQSHWRVSVAALNNLGLGLERKTAQFGAGGQFVALELPLSARTSLEFDGSGQKFQHLAGGGLSLAGEFGLTFGARRLNFSGARLVPLDHTANAALVLRGPAGEQWLTLHHGHYDYRAAAGQMDVWAMDGFVGRDLAALLGSPKLEGALLAQVSLHLNVITAPEKMRKGGSVPNVPAPNWPNQGGFQADLELQNMPQIEETPTGRAGNRVAITPSAFFRNIGSADLPWYSMFSVPMPGGATSRDRAAGEDEDCIDDGSGQCQPYGVDQGGLLVWSVYRLTAGHLEQIGRSGVKHAWNSVNVPGCAVASGRIVGAGCTDRYGVGNNADQNVLGPRSEIQAASVLWEKTGSIWDADNDGDCDSPNPAGFPHHKSWCFNSPADEFEGRLAVNADELTLPGARYFLEAWYLVRQDINIFNSMGYQEITPEFVATTGNGVWTFPCTDGPCGTTTFVNGPVIDAFVDPQAPAAGALSSTYNTFEGRVRLASTVTALGGGRIRYEYALMNFDFDRRIDEFALPLPPFARVTNALVSDGDSDPTNNWSVFISDDELRFNAPTSGVLDWGAMISFAFDAALPGRTGQARLVVNEPGIPALFMLDTNVPLDDVVLADSFE